MQTALLLVHRVLRASQLVASAVAFFNTATSFGVTHSSGFSYRLGSPAASVHLLASYTALLYGAWCVVCVELLALASRPRVPMLRLLDGTLAVLLVSAGVVFQKSDYVDHCDVYGAMLECNGFDTAVTSTYIAAALFVASIGVTFVRCTREHLYPLDGPPTGYVVESTPSNRRPSASHVATVSSPDPATTRSAATPSTKV